MKNRRRELIPAGRRDSGRLRSTTVERGSEKICFRESRTPRSLRRSSPLLQIAAACCEAERRGEECLGCTRIRRYAAVLSHAVIIRWTPKKKAEGSNLSWGAAGSARLRYLAEDSRTEPSSGRLMDRRYREELKQSWLSFGDESIRWEDGSGVFASLLGWLNKRKAVSYPEPRRRVEGLSEWRLISLWWGVEVSPDREGIGAVVADGGGGIWGMIETW